MYNTEKLFGIITGDMGYPHRVLKVFLCMSEKFTIFA